LNIQKNKNKIIYIKRFNLYYYLAFVSTRKTTEFFCKEILSIQTVCLYATKTEMTTRPTLINKKQKNEKMRLKMKWISEDSSENNKRMVKVKEKKTIILNDRAFCVAFGTESLLFESYNRSLYKWIVRQSFASTNL
jgi:hypothetical protein